MAHYRLVKVDCRNPRCKRCLREPSHGPYWYAYWKEPPTYKTRSRYCGKARPGWSPSGRGEGPHGEPAPRRPSVADYERIGVEPGVSLHEARSAYRQRSRARGLTDWQSVRLNQAFARVEHALATKGSRRVEPPPAKDKPMTSTKSPTKRQATAQRDKPAKSPALTAAALYSEAAKLTGPARYGEKTFLGPLLARFGTTPQREAALLAEWQRSGRISLSRADLISAMDRATVRSSEVTHGGVTWHMLAPLVAATSAPTKPRGVPRLHALAAARAELDPTLGLAFVPRMVDRLVASGYSQRDAQSAILAAYGAGLLELRPEGGIARLSQAEMEKSLRGPQQTRLSWARPL